MSLIDIAAVRRRVAQTLATSSTCDTVVAIARGLLRAIQEAEAVNPQDAAEAFEQALKEQFHARMSAISKSYFGEPWAVETAYGVWGRLNDDPRVWGYGSEDEITPLRWLAGATDCWYDGKDLLPVAAWEIRYEPWAEQQLNLVRRTTPGALNPEPFPPSRIAEDGQLIGDRKAATLE